MDTFVRILRTAAALGALLAGSSGSAADQARVEAIVGARCSLCHGQNGEARSPVFPRLAGQHAEYVAKQLADFRSGKRKSEAMKSQVEELTTDDMEALGSYFEAKPASAAAARDPELLAVGRYIFTRGNSFSSVPACVSCHGPRGHGTPLLPRLAGQHPVYIEEQLKQFTTRERTNDNAVMHTVASKLSPLEVHAVAQYVATLD